MRHRNLKKKHTFFSMLLAILFVVLVTSGAEAVNSHDELLQRIKLYSSDSAGDNPTMRRLAMLVADADAATPDLIGVVERGENLAPTTVRFLLAGSMDPEWELDLNIAAYATLLRAGHVNETVEYLHAQLFSFRSAYWAAELLVATRPFPYQAAAPLLDFYAASDWVMDEEFFQETLASGGSEILPVLDIAVDHPYPKIRRVAATSLGLLGEQALPSVPLLLPMIEDDDGSVRAAVVGALARIGPDEHNIMLAFFQGLDDDDVAVRVEAVRALGTLRSNTDEVRAKLIETLESPSSLVAFEATQALAAVGPGAAKETVPVLTEFIKRPKKSPMYREWRSHVPFGGAALALAKLGVKDKKVIRDIVQLWHESRNDSAADALIVIVAPAVRAVAHVAKKGKPSGWRNLFRRGGFLHQIRAIQLLGKMGSIARTETKTLENLLKHNYASVREAAALALGQIDPTASRPVKRLSRVLRTDEDADVRVAAGQALLMIGDKGPVKTLIEMVNEQDDEGWVLGLAATILAALDPSNPAVIQAVTMLLESFEPEARLGAASALGAIGEPAVMAVEKLQIALDDPNMAVRAAAAEALERIK